MHAAPLEAVPRARGWFGLLLRGPDVLAAVTLLALSAVTVVDVVGRYIFSAPIGGADELTIFLMAIGVYAVLPRVSWREEHVCVDIIDLFYPRRGIAARQIALNAIAAAFMTMVTWRMWILAGRMSEDSEVTMFLRLPKGPLTYFFAVMCGFTAVLLCANIVRYALGRGPLQVPAPAPAARDEPPRG
jgi:TRAP-type C4-dicarboxylate transport system permease small subunit